jgi:PAS domain-containing protein
VYKPRLNYKGVIDGLLVFSFEVTEQLRAQQRADALQAQALADAQRHARERETFYQVFEQAPARIALVRGPHHTFTYCNEAYEQLFPGRKLRGRKLADALPEVAAQGFVALLDQVYQSGETYFGFGEAFEMIQPGSSTPTTAYFDYTYQPYREHEQMVGVSIFAYDVTEQVLARQQHETQQQQLRELFEQAPLSICLFGGPDFVYELVSQQH